MFVQTCDTEQRSRDAGTGLIVASLIVALSLLVAAWMGSVGVAPLARAGLLAAATLVGGALLRRRAIIPGLPLLAAGLMAPVVVGGAALGSFNEATSGGALFTALLVATYARTRASGLFATVILAVAVILAAAL